MRFEIRSEITYIEGGITLGTEIPVDHSNMFSIIEELAKLVIPMKRYWGP